MSGHSEHVDAMVAELLRATPDTPAWVAREFAETYVTRMERTWRELIYGDGWRMWADRVRREAARAQQPLPPAVIRWAPHVRLLYDLRQEIRRSGTGL